MNTGKTGIGRFFKGFVYAFEGVVSCIKTERNMRFHIGVAVLVILLMRFYGLSAAETAAVYICIGLVISLELVNTAVEAAVDMACKDKNPLAKKATDWAAGAVLIAGSFCGCGNKDILGLLCFYGDSLLFCKKHMARDSFSRRCDTVARMGIQNAC